MPPTTPSPAGDTTAPPTPPLDSTPQATTGSGTATDPFSMTDSRGFFAPPTLYYFVGGLSAIILAAVLLILVTVICCCGCLRHKVSPADSEQQEKSKMQAPYGEESQKSKDHMTTHHQIQQSSAQPIYEAISNENSSTHSQGSPSSKPLMPPTTGELYASLDNTNTYAQIQPHIPVRGTTSTPSTPATPDPNANYQVLQHRAFSLRRELPGRPQAVNRTALALAHGEVEERDLSGQNKANGVMAGSSRSLPRNTGYSSTSLPLPPEPVHLVPQPPRQEQVQLQNLATEAESSEQANIYHILEPPPQYGNLEQIDEYSQVSNTAVCNNNNRQSPPFSPKYSQHGHIPPHPRSATLPSMHSSPRTSRTNSQSSNSPQTQRQSKSPQISRVGVQKANRPSDSPGSTRGASSSPNVNYSAISNRLSGQSGHSDSNDIQSNFSERSVIDTLVWMKRDCMHIQSKQINLGIWLTVITSTNVLAYNVTTTYWALYRGVFSTSWFIQHCTYKCVCVCVCAFECF